MKQLTFDHPDIISYPITTQALMDLFRHNKLKASKIRPTKEEGIWEIDEKVWLKLALEDRPCTWCGEIMGYEVDPCTKDLCVTCAHPGEDGC